MVSRFCKRFLFYSGIIVYTISRIGPKSPMIRLVILEIYSIFYRMRTNCRGMYISQTPCTLTLTTILILQMVACNCNFANEINT